MDVIPDEELAGEEEPEAEEPAPVVAKSKDDVASADKIKLLSLEDAVERVPESLRKELAEVLRAEFREVRRWKPQEKH